MLWGLAGLQLRKAEPQNLDVGTARPEMDDWTDSESNVRVVLAGSRFSSDAIIMSYLLHVGRHHSNPCNSSPMLSLQSSVYVNVC
jgi:hypothetical protein